ncbi:peptide-methionine (R)-S-oxide reductase MsrB [Geopseudomonas aromaticivorans]
MQKVEKPLEEWREELSESQFQVCRLKGTERAFSGEYYQCKTPGVYHCACCDAPLFDSEAKFDSGCGWPSYFQPVAAEALRQVEDFSHGMHRIEVLCARCDAHLGHVFPDGPAPTGLRYCINSVSLRLKARE